MDLEKAYDLNDINSMWKVLNVYRVGGRLLRTLKSFCKECKARVRNRMGILINKGWAKTGMHYVSFVV